MSILDINILIRSMKEILKLLCGTCSHTLTIITMLIKLHSNSSNINIEKKLRDKLLKHMILGG